MVTMSALFLNLLLSLFVCFFATSAGVSEANDWSLSALPSSVRLDPSSGKILESRPDLYRMDPLGDLLQENWIYDGRKVQLYAARGEYVSFQIVLENRQDQPLRDIMVEMAPFSKDGKNLEVDPELFLEWAVEVKVPSTGYEKTSVGIQMP